MSRTYRKFKWRKKRGPQSAQARREGCRTKLHCENAKWAKIRKKSIESAKFSHVVYNMKAAGYDIDEITNSLRKTHKLEDYEIAQLLEWHIDDQFYIDIQDIVAIGEDGDKYKFINIAEPSAIPSFLIATIDIGSWRFGTGRTIYYILNDDELCKVDRDQHNTPKLNTTQHSNARIVKYPNKTLRYVMRSCVEHYIDSGLEVDYFFATRIDKGIDHCKITVIE